MSRLDRFQIAAWITVALLSAGASRAMQIREFDKLAGPDQDEYIADLIEGAEKVLVNEGRVDLATQVRNLFATNAPGDQASIGMAEFYLNLARGRLADAKRVAADANARRIEVEDALAVTLKKNGIELPVTFFTVNGGFKPKLPLQE